MDNYFESDEERQDNLPTLISNGQSFSLAIWPSLDIGLAKSGVNGPFTWGSNCKIQCYIYKEKKAWLSTKPMIFVEI